MRSWRIIMLYSKHGNETWIWLCIAAPFLRIKYYQPSLVDIITLKFLYSLQIRNLSLGGGPDVCIKMVEQDVMTPLGTFVQQVLRTSWNRKCCVMLLTESLEKAKMLVNILIEDSYLYWKHLQIILSTFSLLMPWVLLMSVQAIQSLKDNQQAWQFRLWAYCGTFGEWRYLCMEYCGCSCCTNYCCVKLHHCNPVLVERKMCCQILHCFNAFFYCFILHVSLNLLLINDHFFSSESSNVAVDVFNKQGLLPYLVSSLKTDIYPKTVSIPAGEMLLFL